MLLNIKEQTKLQYYKGSKFDSIYLHIYYWKSLNRRLVDSINEVYYLVFRDNFMKFNVFHTPCESSTILDSVEVRSAKLVNKACKWVRLIFTKLIQMRIVLWLYQTVAFVKIRCVKSTDLESINFHKICGIRGFWLRLPCWPYKIDFNRLKKSLPLRREIIVLNFYQLKIQIQFKIITSIFKKILEASHCCAQASYLNCQMSLVWFFCG